jgi:stress-induced morphogen
MAMEGSEIERLIKEGIPDARVQMTDLVGDKDHWAAVVISTEFTGKSKLQQHQIVYKALGANMGGVLHALQLTTYAPKAPQQ